ncbi:MAG TPA: hypothetical protein VIB79_23580 [Candidatus Binatia bacterium]|jgi:ABC-type nitrate/sulfonate/bicarbonate transport system substrate-binding protein
MERLTIGQLSVLILAGFFFLSLSPVHSADKIKFPYSPVGWESLSWFVGKEGGYFEKYGLDVDL